MKKIVAAVLLAAGGWLGAAGGGPGLRADIAAPAGRPAPRPAPELRPGVPFPLADRDMEHFIAPGEILYAIARRHNVAYPAIVRANRLANPNRIYAGQALLIPRRAILPAPPAAGPGAVILLNIPEYRLYLFQGGQLTRIYPVAIGLTTWRTPLGPFEVLNKARDPSWHVPPGISRERGLAPGTVVPPGPDNPLGGHWIGTSIRHTGLHGTNAPMSIGFPLSRGCVRLYPEDVGELFARVAPGDRGIFLYEPVKATVSGGVILLEIHSDIYGLVPDMETHTRRKLEEACGHDPLALSFLDPAAVARALSEFRGVPVPVGRLPGSGADDGLH